MEKQPGRPTKLTAMKKLILYCMVALIATACSDDDYIIGGEVNETNQVDQTTFDFLKSFEPTTQTAQLIERAGLVDEVNGEVTVIAPSNYAVNRYLRRKTHRAQRLDPASAPMTLEDIPTEELQQLRMYIVDQKYWRETIPEGGIILPTHSPGDTVRLTVAESTAEPGAAWDGGSTPGWGYQYPNFMQTTPKKVFVHFKRGDNWEMDANERVAMGYDHPECDQVYQMYISDVLTTTGVVHVIYAGNYNYSDHYYYHSLFFFGTRADDLL